MAESTYSSNYGPAIQFLDKNAKKLGLVAPDFSKVTRYREPAKAPIPWGTEVPVVYGQKPKETTPAASAPMAVPPVTVPQPSSGMTVGDAKYLQRQSVGAEPQYATQVPLPAKSSTDGAKSDLSSTDPYTLDANGFASAKPGMVPPMAKSTAMDDVNSFVRQRDNSAQGVAISNFDLAQHGEPGIVKSVDAKGNVSYGDGVNPYASLKFAANGGRTALEQQKLNQAGASENYQAAMARSAAVGMPNPDVVQQRIQAVMDMPVGTTEEIREKKAALAGLRLLLEANGQTLQANTAARGQDITAMGYSARLAEQQAADDAAMARVKAQEAGATERTKMSTTASREAAKAKSDVVYKEKRVDPQTGSVTEIPVTRHMLYQQYVDAYSKAQTPEQRALLDSMAMQYGVISERF